MSDACECRWFFFFTLCGEELKAVAGVRARFPCVFLFVSTLDMRSRFVREREWPVRQTRVRSFIFLLLRKSFVNDWNSVQPSSVSQFPDDTDGRAKKIIEKNPKRRQFVGLAKARLFPKLECLPVVDLFSEKKKNEKERAFSFAGHAVRAKNSRDSLAAHSEYHYILDCTHSAAALVRKGGTAEPDTCILCPRIFLRQTPRGCKTDNPLHTVIRFNLFLLQEKNTSRGSSSAVPDRP